MFKNIQHKSIILASQSPRRRYLLSDLGINFKVETKSIKEDFPSDMDRLKIAEYLAIKKASVFSPRENEIIIAADTVVIHKNNVLNKPKNKEDAKRILTRLSNTNHEVITGVCLYQKNKKISFSERTSVNFRRLTNSEIDFYVENHKTDDKSGAYGIQDWIGKIGIESIEGCYYNAMGLPLSTLYNYLLKL